MEWVPCSAKVGSYVWSVDSTHQALPELWFPYIHPSCNSMKHEGNLGIRLQTFVLVWTGKNANWLCVYINATTILKL